MDNQSSVDSSKVPLCKCKDEAGVPCFAVHRLSKTDKNKDRAFYACSMSRDKGGCGFFCWIEDLYIDEKTGLAKKKYIPPPEGYVKKPTPAENMVALDLRVVALENLAEQFKIRIASLEEENLRFTFLEQQHEQLQQQSRPVKIQKTESARAPNSRKQ